MRASSKSATTNVFVRAALGWASALAMSFAMPALSQPIIAAGPTLHVGEVVEIDSSVSLGALRMDGGLLRLFAPTGRNLSVSAFDASLERGMIYNAYTQGPVTTLTLNGTTQVPGGPVGAPPADGMYLHGSYFDSSGFDVINKGNLIQASGRDLKLLGRARLVNEGTYSMTDFGGVSEFTGGTPNEVSFLNKGTLQKSGSFAPPLITTSTILVPFDQEGGQVKLLSDTISFARGGTHKAATFDADAGNKAPTGFIEFGGAHTFSDVTTKGGTFHLLGSIGIATNQEWRQQAPHFESQGQITIANGASLNNTGSFQQKSDPVKKINPITISDSTIAGTTKLLNSGSLQLEGSPITIGSGSTFDNTGLLQLLDHSSIRMGDAAIGAPAATLLNGGNGDFKIAGSSSIRIGPTGTLDNSSLLQIQDSSSITLAGGTLINRGTLVSSQPSNLNALQGTGWLLNQADGTFQGNIARTHEAPGRNEQLISVSNEGQFIVGAGNVVSVNRFDNGQGTLTVDGQLNLFGGQLNLIGGTLNGSGSINGKSFIGGGPGIATFAPGHSPGAMFIDGDFSLLPRGVLELEVAYVDGILQADQVFVADGDVLLAGQVRFLIGPDIVLGDLDAFPPLFGCDGCSIVYGSTFSVDFPGRPGSQVELLDSGLRIVALGELGTTTPVPEPSMFMMMVAGVSAMGVVAVRRRRMASSAQA